MVCKHYNHNSIDTQLLSFFSRLTILIITKCNVKIMPTLKKRRRKSCKMWEIISAEHEKPACVEKKTHISSFQTKDETTLFEMRWSFGFDVPKRISVWRRNLSSHLSSSFLFFLFFSTASKCNIFAFLSQPFFHSQISLLILS